MQRKLREKKGEQEKAEHVSCGVFFPTSSRPLYVSSLFPSKSRGCTLVLEIPDPVLVLLLRGP